VTPIGAYLEAREIFFYAATLAAVVLFILGLKRLSSPATARTGNRYAAAGMLLAIVASIWETNAVGWWVVLAGIVVGGAIGLFSALKVKMTAMPQMVALFNGAGGGAAALISTSEFFVAIFGRGSGALSLNLLIIVSLVVSAIIGAVSFSGSIVAFLKLQEWMTGRPVTYKGQQAVNALLGLLIVALALVVMATVGNVPWYWYVGMLAGALLFGVLFVLPIGGADMPVVISLLNSFTGVAVAITGFELNYQLLIVSGTLVGASGTLLTILMGKAMNRPLTNVLFGAFGAGGGMEPAGAAAGGGPQNIRATSTDDVAVMLAYAHQVIVVPGYGMAVAQAQHSVRELADQLEKKGVAVKYAIHPVAGRMPGHMNVLLAEANVPYEQLYDLEQINPEFERCDVALVIGANDVVNPAARYDKASPIYGMPILDADKAQHIIVVKRSLNPGFAGIDNELYEDPKTSMLFGDAKASVDGLVAAVKAL
jgi:NAD(P) transhydrogenase subunit beta